MDTGMYKSKEIYINLENLKVTQAQWRSNGVGRVGKVQGAPE